MSNVTRFMREVTAGPRSIVTRYAELPTINLSPERFDPDHALIRSFLYYLMPVWTGAGVVDWWWHRKTDIEHTSGLRESLIHALMFTEVGVPILLGMLCRINAGSLLAMFGAAFVHEGTAIWDVDVAVHHREVAPREQHTHSFLEVIPFTACVIASCLHWGQLRALFHLGDERPDLVLRMKERKIPNAYWPVMAGMIGCVAALYGNELWRCWRVRDQRHYNTGFYAPR